MDKLKALSRYISGIVAAVLMLVIYTYIALLLFENKYWFSKPECSPPSVCESDIALEGCEDIASSLNRQLEQSNRRLTASETDLERLAYKLDVCENIIMLRQLRIKR